MRYETGAAFRRALEQRLKDLSRETGVSLPWLRKVVSFHRLLARLLAVAPDRWVLKGALALEFRLGITARTTKDIDLVYHADEEALIADLMKAQALNLGDFFVFAIERTESLQEVGEPPVARYHVHGELGGRVFEELTMDVGFSDPLRWQPDIRRGQDFLRFAGIEPVEVPVLPLVQQVAEKVHAYTRVYTGGHRSTRAKDLVDLVLVARSERLEAGRLREALDITFRVRKGQGLPKALPSPPADWGPAHLKLATQVGLDPDLEAGYAEAATFLDPILSGMVEGEWDPGRRAWLAPREMR